MVKMQGVGEVGGRRRRRDAGSWTGRADSYHVLPEGSG